ncbi:hypothetical protein PRIC2_012309 [Phytophthora ramorum]
MVASTTSLSAMLAMTVLAAGVNSHGYMTEPAVTFLSSSTDNTQFIATIESSASGFSGTFSGSPADNTAAFTTAFASSSYTSLKDLITGLATVTVTDATLTCGSCDPDETAQALPAELELWHEHQYQHELDLTSHHNFVGLVQLRLELRDVSVSVGVRGDDYGSHRHYCDYDGDDYGSYQHYCDYDNRRSCDNNSYANRHDCYNHDGCTDHHFNRHEQVLGTSSPRLRVNCSS